MELGRRTFIIGAPLALAACSSEARRPMPVALSVPEAPPVDPQAAEMYAAIDDEPFPVPAIDVARVDPKWLRTIVDFDGPEEPGTVVVDTEARHAYLVLEGDRAIRYGVGVGKTEALAFSGEALVGRKAEWPRWTPTSDMIAREPERYGHLSDGMPGGDKNPLGPRAIYLYRDGVDTLFRLHGTTEPRTIGRQVSSGCVRFMNQDVIDLYRRVLVGARVVVRTSVAPPPAPVT